MRATAIRTSLLGLALLVVAACGDDDSTPIGAAGSGSGGGAGSDDSLVPCLDRPEESLRPPVSGLPCDLLPPGFGR